MTTATDTQWTNRLNAILANFNSNESSSFNAGANNLYASLYNRIGKTVINNPDHAGNRFSKWDKSTMDFGDTLQMIKSKILAGQTYNPDAETPFGGSRNSPIAEYHKMNLSMQYELQVTEQDAKRAFVNADTLGNFVASQLDTLQASREYDQYIQWKKFLSDKSKFAGSAYETLSANTGEAMWEKLRQVIQSMRFPSSDYNAEGDVAMSDALTVVITAENHRLLDDYLKDIYHYDLVSLGKNVDIIDVDSFATPTGSDVIAFEVIDDRTPGFWPKTPIATAAFNARSLGTTNFLTVQGTYTFAKFRNAYCAIKA